MDFDRIGFVERVARAGSETAYSAAIAWLLGQDSPLPLNERLSIIESLVRRKLPGCADIDAETEVDNIDIVVSLHHLDGAVSLVAIENKIKATDGKLQLETYDQKLVSMGEVEAKVFLTLTGEQPRSGRGWLAVSYGTLADALEQQTSSALPIVADLLKSIQRMFAVGRLTLLDSSVASHAFGDQFVGMQSTASIRRYIDRLKLHKALQRVWMNQVATDLLPDSERDWSIHFDESNGQALVNLTRKHPRFLDFAIGLQLQGRSLKLFVAPDPYPKVATGEQHFTVATLLAELSNDLGQRHLKVSSTGSRGFRSVTVDKLPPTRDVGSWRTILAPWIRRVMAANSLCEAPRA